MGLRHGRSLLPAHFPEALDDFVDRVIPELQRRRLFRKDYQGTMLRDHLGLPKPQNRFANAHAAASCWGMARYDPLCALSRASSRIGIISVDLQWRPAKRLVVQPLNRSDLGAVVAYYFAASGQPHSGVAADMLERLDWFYDRKIVPRLSLSWSRNRHLRYVAHN